MTEAIKIGSYIADSSEFVISGIAEPSVSNYMTFEYPVGTDIEVPTDKELIITGVLYHFTSADGRIYLGYGDNGIGDQAGAPTNPVQITKNIGGNVALNEYFQNLWCKIPTGKFPFIKSVNIAPTVMIFGIIKES